MWNVMKREEPQITRRCLGLGNGKDGVATIRVVGGYRWSRLMGKIRNRVWTCWCEMSVTEMLVGQLGI